MLMDAVKFLILISPFIKDKKAVLPIQKEVHSFCNTGLALQGLHI